MMDINKAIEHAKKVAEEKYIQGMLCHANPNDGELDDYINCGREHEQLAEWLEELKLYKEIGTLEEVQVAMEKRTPVKPKIKKTSRTVTDIYDCVWEEKADIYECPCCNSFICFVGGNHNIYHCFGCGQKLDWSEQK